MVTHPSCIGSASKPTRAADFLEALVSTDGAQILHPGAGFLQRCLRVAKAQSVCGPRVFDLQIGLLCVESGVTELLTHDAGFIALAGLKIRDPIG